MLGCVKLQYHTDRYYASIALENNDKHKKSIIIIIYYLETVNRGDDGFAGIFKFKMTY